VDVTITSAAPLTAEQERQYATALKQRLDAMFACISDRSRVVRRRILRADDLVIDGSLRGRLERLGVAMAPLIIYERNCISWRLGQEGIFGP